MLGKNRIVYFDLLKLFAVLLVIVGHIISQYDDKGYNHPINVWIYSFHMSLFMFMSGIFFDYTLKRKFKDVIQSKSILLLLPLFTWSIVNFILNDLLITPIQDWGKAIWHYLVGLGPLHGLWYLKCLFIYLIICFLAVKILKNKILASISTIVLFMLLPDVNFSSQMIVFFWAGYFYDRINDNVVSKNTCNVSILAGAGVIMLFLLFFWWQPDYSYLHRSKSLFEYIVFFIMGISSTLFWVQLFKLLFQDRRKKWINSLSNIGVCSLGIYCSQEYFYISHLWGGILERYDNTIFYVVWAVVVLFVSYGLVLLLQRNKYTSLFFLGIYNLKE